MSLSKLLCILGSTSTGKTDVALKLAGKFNGELVSCDSRQVYKGLDIGTGKLPGEKVSIKKGKGFWEMGGVKVWMYDVAESKKEYSVYDYVKDANKVIEDIAKRGKLPIIVGGTGLYLKALVEGLPNLAIPINLKLRKQLGSLTLLKLQKKFQKVSPDRWEKMNNSDRQNPRRLIRAIEVTMSNHEGDPSSPALPAPQDDNLGLEIIPKLSNVNVLKVGLTAPREVLYQRIDERVVSRIKEGVIEEAESLHKKGLSFKRMEQLGLEYGILSEYLQGNILRTEELVKILQGKIHGYARRQETWFKKEKDVYWFDITKEGWFKQVEKKVCTWYYLKNDQTN